jgi:hypothetical protein
MRDSYDEWLADDSDLTYKEWCEARTYPTHFKMGGGMTALAALTATTYTFATVPLVTGNGITAVRSLDALTI